MITLDLEAGIGYATLYSRDELICTFITDEEDKWEAISVTGRWVSEVPVEEILEKLKGHPFLLEAFLRDCV